MLKNLTPYKDLFIHYGLLTTKLNSILLDIFKNNFIYIFIISFFSICIFTLHYGPIFSKIYKYLFFYYWIDNYFFFHPFAIFPWHTYYIFFLVNVFLLFRFSTNIYLNYFSYFILSLIILFSESFWLASILILIFDIFFINVYFKNKLKVNFYNLSAKITIYLIPLIIFFIYLFVNDIFDYWLIYNQMGKAFLEILNMSYFQIIISFFDHLFNYTFKRVFSEPNWLIYSLIILINVIYLLFFVLRKFRKKITNEDCNLMLISFCSLVLLYQTLHSVSIFKFSCGLIIGLVIILKIIFNIKNFDNKLILSSIILLYSMSAFSFSKNNSNQLYVYKFKKDEYVNDDYFDYFKSQKWDVKTWNHLKITDQTIKKISSKCRIKNGVNFSSDGIISVIMRENLIFNQLLPWYENIKGSWQNKYFNTMWKYFDKDYFDTIEDMIENNNVIIYSNLDNYPYLKFYDKEIYLKNNMVKN